MSSTATYRAFVDHLGAYVATKSYVPMDEVRFGTPGGTYRNILACTGITPTVGSDNTNWVLVSAPGATGANGANGANGMNGVDATAPIGSLIFFAAGTAPTNYLPANTGAAVSRTTYADLFAVIGTTYGAGDGTTTFNLPKITDFGRVPCSNDAYGNPYTFISDELMAQATAVGWLEEAGTNVWVVPYDDGYPNHLFGVLAYNGGKPPAGCYRNSSNVGDYRFFTLVNAVTNNKLLPCIRYK